MKRSNNDPDVINKHIRTIIYEVPDADLEKAITILTEYEKKLKMYGFIYSTIKKAKNVSIIIVSYIFRETARLHFASLTTFFSLMTVYAVHRKRQHKNYLKREIENQEAILINHYNEEIYDHTLRIR